MSTLSSASTLAQVQAAYDDNASYAEDESTDKARAFITAARILLRRLPSQAQHGPASVTLNDVRRDLEEASAWLASYEASANAGVIHLDVRELRP